MPFFVKIFEGFCHSCSCVYTPFPTLFRESVQFSAVFCVSAPSPFHTLRPMSEICRLERRDIRSSLGGRRCKKPRHSGRACLWAVSHFPSDTKSQWNHFARRIFTVRILWEGVEVACGEFVVCGYIWLSSAEYQKQHYFQLTIILVISNGSSIIYIVVKRLFAKTEYPNTTKFMIKYAMYNYRSVCSSV